MSVKAIFTTVRFNIKHTCAIWMAYRQSSSQASADDSQNSDKYEEDIRNKILEASLPFVNNLGWTKDAICAGAESIGYPGITHGMFARSGGDLINYFQKSSNQKLVVYMKKVEHSERNMPPAEFVEDAVKVRLEMIVPYLPRWPQAIAVMSLPPNVPTALASQLTLVDDICYYAGDRSVDFSWYARRIALAAIYKATELYMIQDKSQDFVETWKFLNNRLTEAIQIQNLLINSDASSTKSTDTLTAAFITARNILGLSNR